MSIRVFSWILLGVLLANPLKASEPAQQSVEKLRSILQSIDPYRPQHAVKGKLVVYGSGSMDGLMHAWADNFRDFHAQAQVEVSGLPEDAAIKKLVSEPTSIWMVSRPIAASELAELKQKGLRNPVALEVAKEAMGVFVHKSNPVTTINRDQMRAVFTNLGTDAVPTWKMMGASGPIADQPIKIIRRSDTSGTQKFLENVLFGVPMRDGTAVDSNAQVVGKIREEVTAIGICGLKCGGTEAKPLNLKLGESVIPSDDMAILSGAYPLVRPMSIVIDLGADSPERQEFVRYMLSQSGQSETVIAGLFPVELPVLRAELQSIAVPTKR